MLRKILTQLPAFFFLALLAFGCASPGANPPTARANTGYVDFFTVPADELAWDVQRFDAAANKFKPVYSKVDPIPDGVLRLAFTPGTEKLRVTLLNRVVAEPVVVEVEIHDGQITPVQITLTGAGTVAVQTRQYSYGGSTRGRVGHRYKYGADDTQTYSLTAAVQAPKPYAPKPASSEK